MDVKSDVWVQTEEEEVDLKATFLLATAVSNCVLLYSDVTKPRGKRHSRIRIVAVTFPRVDL